MTRPLFKKGALFRKGDKVLFLNISGDDWHHIHDGKIATVIRVKRGWWRRLTTYEIKFEGGETIEVGGGDLASLFHDS